MTRQTIAWFKMYLVWIDARQTIKYLEFLSLSEAKKHCESKFDYDPFDAHSSGGDIVYKILGIDPDETMSRTPSIIISKKVRKDPDAQTVDMIEEDALGPPNELENLRNMLRQEELHDESHKLQRLKSSSRTLLNKKRDSFKLVQSWSTEHDETSLHESQSEISLYKPAPPSRESATELGSNIVKKVKRSKYGRSSSDGVGMAALLVRSMMAAPSLESIAENADITSASSMHNLIAKKHHQPHHIENKLNISVGDSIIDLKAADGTLSEGISMSSIVSISESSSEDEECSELGDEVVMIDADTISM